MHTFAAKCLAMKSFMKFSVYIYNKLTISEAQYLTKQTICTAQLAIHGEQFPIDKSTHLKQNGRKEIVYDYLCSTFSTPFLTN